MRIKNISIIILLLFALNLKAQKDFTLYNFNAIPQATKINPSIIPETKICIGVPGLSSININFFNSAFKPSDIIRERPQDDSLSVDVDYLITKLENNNYFNIDLNTELLFIGFKLNKGFLSFGVDQNFSFRFDYSADLIKLLWYGNDYFYNNPAYFNNTNIDLMHYLSYHVGYSYKINDKISIGTRLKFLKGISNINVEKMNLSLNTVNDPLTTYTFEGNYDFKINTAGFYDEDYYKNNDYLIGEKNDFDIANYLFNKNNNGYAIDLGLTYIVNNNFTVNASINDLGFINWKSNTINYTSENSEFFFNGISFDENNDSTDIFEATLDTISDIFKTNSAYENYKTNLHTKYYFSAYYNINEKNKIGLLFFGRKYRNFYEKAFSINYNLKACRNFRLIANYTIFENKYDNFGLGMSFNLGSIQTYFISDNIISAFSPFNPDRVNIRFGININIRSRNFKQTDENAEA